MISKRIQNIQPSATLSISAKAKSMRAAGVPIISFSAGEPDFPTPKHIRDYVVENLESASTYTNVRGIIELREEISKDIKRSHGLTYAADSQIIVSCGAKHSLFNTLMTVIDPGDEVIVFAPYWVSYPEMIKVAGGVPVFVDTTPDNFQINPLKLADAITPKTKAIMVNSPSNPSGAVYSNESLKALAVACTRNNLVPILDEIYRHLTYNGNFQSLLHVAPSLFSRAVLIDGASKAYAMTGWRIGYTMGPKEIIGGMTKLQGQSTSNPTHVAQLATLAALRGGLDCVSKMKLEYDKRRTIMTDKLNAISGVSCMLPSGAFYVFPNVSSYIQGSIESDVDLCNYLLETAGVATVPGSAFGSPGHLRMSYACSVSDIETGIEKMKKALDLLA